MNSKLIKISIWMTTMKTWTILITLTSATWETISKIRTMLSIICNSTSIKIDLPNCSLAKSQHPTASSTMWAHPPNLKTITASLLICKGMNWDNFQTQILVTDSLGLTPTSRQPKSMEINSKLINQISPRKKLMEELLMKMSKNYERLYKKMKPYANYARRNNKSKIKLISDAKKPSRSF